MWMRSSYKKHPLLSLLNPLSPYLMIPMKSFLKKHNNGNPPQVANTKGRRMMFVEDSLNIPNILISKKVGELKEPADLDDKWVISTYAFKEGSTTELNKEAPILVVCDSSMELIF